MRTSPYLNFDGNCADAFRFYEKTFPGKELQLMKFGDMQKDAPVAARDRIMHARLVVGETAILGSDTFGDAGYRKPAGMHVTLSVDTPADADRIFAALTDGGTIDQPIAETFFAHRFGMVTDRFGTPWMIIAEKPM